MPIYEYTCQACGVKFEQLVRTMSGADDAKFKCPECGSPKTARALSVFAVADSAAKGTTPEAPMCGRCGGAPGSCAM